MAGAAEAPRLTLSPLTACGLIDGDVLQRLKPGDDAPASIGAAAGLVCGLSQDGKRACICLGGRGVLLRFRDARSARNAGKSSITGLLSAAAPDGETVTAATILTLVGVAGEADGGREKSVAVTGSSKGTLSFFTLEGQLLTTQVFHRSSVLEIKFRAAGTLALPSSEVVLVQEGGVMVRLDSYNVFSELQARLVQVSMGISEAGPSMPLPCTKHELAGLSGFRDAACAEVGPGAGLEAGRGRVSFVAAAGEPFVSRHVAGEAEKGRVGAVALASSVIGAVTSLATSTVFSMAKSFWKSAPAQAPPRRRGRRRGPRPGGAGERGGAGGAARPAAGRAARGGDALGRLLACADSLGRVLLADAPTFLLLRVFKGYRDAQVAFIDGPSAAEGAGSRASFASPARASPTSRPLAAAPEGQSAAPRPLHLVIHAPRRGLVEVWDVPFGKRTAACTVPEGSRLLPGGFRLSAAGGASDAADTATAFLLTPAGAISRVNVPAPSQIERLRTPGRRQSSQSAAP
eukprot:tig00001339_g8282.t1